MSRSLRRGAGKRGILSTGAARQVVREIWSSGDRQNAILPGMVVAVVIGLIVFEVVAALFQVVAGRGQGLHLDGPFQRRQ